MNEKTSQTNENIFWCLFFFSKTNHFLLSRYWSFVFSFVPNHYHMRFIALFLPFFFVKSMHWMIGYVMPYFLKVIVHFFIFTFLFLNIKEIYSLFKPFNQWTSISYFINHSTHLRYIFLQRDFRVNSNRWIIKLFMFSLAREQLFKRK